MEQAVNQTTWQGLRALQLESEALCAVVVPEVGAKLVSLFDKRNGMEWLVAPGEKPLRPVAYGAPFVEQDMSGWDEMFPTITACHYPAPGAHDGALLPDHGEVWALPWSVVTGTPEQMTLAVEGRALPYRLSRTLTFAAPDTLQLAYKLTNDGSENLAYLWAAHPQFDCGEELEVLLPAQVQRVVNSLPPEWGWGLPGTEHGWPEATDLSGQPVRIDRVGPPTLHRARKFFVAPNAAIDGVTLIRRPSEARLRMAWAADELPYFGLWIDEGALSHASVVAPEPMTGYYDSLDVAWRNNRVSTIAPGLTQSWTLTIQLDGGSTL